MSAIDTPNNERWMARRNCWDADPELFFSNDPAGVKRRGHVKNAEAKRICGGCDVRLDCLTFAQENDEWGVWGGLDEDERAELVEDGAA